MIIIKMGKKKLNIKQKSLTHTYHIHKRRNRFRWNKQNKKKKTEQQISFVYILVKLLSFFDLVVFFLLKIENCLWRHLLPSGMRLEIKKTVTPLASFVTVMVRPLVHCCLMTTMPFSLWLFVLFFFFSL